MSYYKLLSKKKWLKKRLKILKRDGNKCTVCGKEYGLVVHHTYYINGHLPWDYPDEYLLTLCNDCHYNFHCTNEVPIKGIIQKPIEKTEPRYRKKINGIWVEIKVSAL